MGRGCVEAGAECAGLGVSFVTHPWIPAAGGDGGAGKRSSSFQKTPFVFSLAAGTAMRKRMVKDLSNSRLGKGGKSPPKSCLTFMPGSAQPWLCPWASPGCVGTPRLSWVPPGPPVQQQGGESSGQNESPGEAFPWFIHIPGILVRWL